MTKPTKRWIVFSLLFLLGFSIAIWWQRDRSVEIRQVVLISIDTCRANYMGCYGYPGAITPNIDVVAEEGILFRRAVAPSPLTRPSHATMLTGTIPPYHGVHANGFAWLGQDNTTLAEILTQNNYQTGAIISTFVLDSQFGLDQGFETYDDNFGPATQENPYPQRRGEKTSKLACSWLEAHKNERFFLFLHFFDPHDPYEPPEPFASQFPDSAYAGEVAYTDQCVREVIDKLKELGLYESTLLIITSDHGESLSDHGEQTHGYFIYDSVIRIPLIIKPPKGCSKREVSEAVGLVDIVPTILGQLGILIPTQVTGQDLSEYFLAQPQQNEQRYIYSESMLPIQYDSNPLLAVVSRHWKYIWTTRPELYDLSQDENETANLAANEPEIADELRNRLQLILAEQSRTSQANPSKGLDEQAKARLESLGYTVSGKISEVLTIDPHKEDPKDLIGFHQNKDLLTSLMEQGQYEQAKNLCARILAEQSNQSLTHRMLGQLSYLAGEFEEAIEHYTQALQLKPDDYLTHNNLATVLYQQDRRDEAIWHWQESLRLYPEGQLARRNLEEAHSGWLK